MPDPIQFSAILGSGPIGAAAVPPGVGAPAVQGRDFKSILMDSLDEVNRLQNEADRGVQSLLTGETDNVGEVLTAVNKAGVAFDLLMEIRNKLTEAYREIQQMQV